MHVVFIMKHSPRPTTPRSSPGCSLHGSTGGLRQTRARAVSSVSKDRSTVARRRPPRVATCPLRTASAQNKKVQLPMTQPWCFQGKHNTDTIAINAHRSVSRLVHILCVCMPSLVIYRSEVSVRVRTCELAWAANNTARSCNIIV